jgi:hypothetical protein
MANAKRDANMVPVKLGASNADGVTPLMIQANPSTHQLQVNNGTSGSDQGKPQAERDQNMVPIMMAVSSADGKTPVELYVDLSTNLLLVKSS